MLTHCRLRQVDVKAEHFERQVQRAEQERDAMEKKYEVRSVPLALRPTSARFAVFTNSPMLSPIYRKHWRSTVSRKPSSTNSSRPWTRSPNRTASSPLVPRALSASIAASSSAHHVYVTPYQFFSLPLLPDQNLLRSIFLYIAYVALSPNTPKHTDSPPFPLVSSFSVVVWSNRSKRNISIPISWTFFISCQ